MRTGAGIVVLSLGLALLSGWLPAEELESTETEGRGTKNETPGPVASKPGTRVRVQLNRLIREEAGIASPVSAMEKEGTEPAAAETLQLEPMVVEGRRAVAWPPPLRENKLQEVLRTGTLWERVGSRFTKRFWVKGDRGLGFTISW